jgi:O-methyltransferase
MEVKLNAKSLASLFVKNRIELLDKINNSAGFTRDCDELFGAAARFEKRTDLYQSLLTRIGDEPITYLEFGVFRGESFKFWAKGNTHPESRFVGFDTFTGLPEDWLADHPAGAFSTDGAMPQVDDQRASFVKGRFQDTLYGFLEENPPRDHRLVVHLDADLYSATLFVLAVMDRFLRPGSILVFDEFASLNHEYEAWRDYRRSFPPRQWKGLGSTPGAMQVAVELES